MLGEVLSDLYSCFRAVAIGHREVHDDQLVCIAKLLILLLDHILRLEAIYSLIGAHFNHTQEGFISKDVVAVVVDDQNLVFVVDILVQTAVVLIHILNLFSGLVLNMKATIDLVTNC